MVKKSRARHQQNPDTDPACRSLRLALLHVCDLFNLTSARNWDTDRCLKTARRDLWRLTATSPTIAEATQVLDVESGPWANPDHVVTRLRRRRRMILAFTRTVRPSSPRPS
ncbi:MAG: hypothetical protein H0W83_17520 [Planctomycetes bacterium]|nr:hypothetical protein [Planctomycetota bacterium]